MTFVATYTVEVRQEAVALAALVGASAAARQRGVPASTVWRWARQQGVAIPRTRQERAPPVMRRFARRAEVAPAPLAAQVRECPPHHWDVNNARYWICLKCAGVKEIPPMTLGGVW